ncbi:MAG: hypothetical protein Q9166_006807 [cf. Caloplaca sp. 2 TL-2023]
MAKSGGVHFEQESRRCARHAKSSAQANQAKRKQKVTTVIDLVEDEMSQDEIDTKAASAIRELFPKIPERDVQQIVSRAFTKGQAKVGTAKDQPFIRRVHLAVGAHIRHMYTDYDRLLKEHKHGWLDARAMVQPVTLDKIIEWRDEKDEPDAVEDILREVIVIPDDEDEDNEFNLVNDRQNSMEVISNQELADTVHVQPVDYGALNERSRFDRPVSPEDDWAASVKFIRRISTPLGKARQRQEQFDRQQAQRNRIWHEAVSRRRDTTHTERVMATHRMDRSLDRRLALSNHAYPQPSTSDAQADESRLGLIEHRPVYANGDIEQPSVGSSDRRWDSAVDHVSKIVWVLKVTL